MTAMTIHRRAHAGCVCLILSKLQTHDSAGYWRVLFPGRLFSVVQLCVPMGCLSHVHCMSASPEASAGLHQFFMATGIEEHDRGICHLWDSGRQLGAAAGSCVFTDMQLHCLATLDCCSS